MKKSMLTALAAFSAAALALTSCANPPDPTASGSAAPTSNASATASAQTTSGKKFSACMVSDSGGFNDKSFNETSHNGLLRAEKELGIDIKDVQSKKNSDFATNIQAMITAKCDLIITVGFLLKDATIAAAKANPDIKFAIVDSPSEGTLPNHKGLGFNTAESSFMAGYLAAGMSKTGKVGTFGGMKIPTVTIFMDGFAQGVDYYNKQKGKKIQVIGWDAAKQDGSFVPGANPFENQAGGKDTANSLVSLGADILFPVAGPAGLGGLEVAKTSKGKVSAIWVDTDGCVSAQSYCSVLMSSVAKAMDVAVFDTIKAASDGTFTSDEYVGTLKNGGTTLSPFHEFESKVPAELKSELDKIKSDIESGAITIESKSQPK